MSNKKNLNKYIKSHKKYPIYDIKIGNYFILNDEFYVKVNDPMNGGFREAFNFSTNQLETKIFEKNEQAFRVDGIFSII